MVLLSLANFTSIGYLLFSRWFFKRVAVNCTTKLLSKHFPMYVFEDPEPNGEVEQDLMMELDYRTLHALYMLRCVCVCLDINVCLGVYCYLLQIGPFSFMYMPFVTCLL